MLSVYSIEPEALGHGSSLLSWELIHSFWLGQLSVSVLSESFVHMCLWLHRIVFELRFQALQVPLLLDMFAAK